jgi:hypothetical protein
MPPLKFHQIPSFITKITARLKNVENFEWSFLKTAKMRVTWFFHAL